MANTPGPQKALGTRGQTINADAWPYFDALLRAVAEATGEDYDDLITEATRTRARQNYLYVNRNRPGFNPAWPPDSPFAYHVAGNAVDFGAGAGYRGTPVNKALHQLGPLLGIYFEIDGEEWHGAFDRARAPKTIPAIFADPTPSPPNPKPKEDDDMLTLIAGSTTGWTAPYVLDPADGKRRSVSNVELAIYRSRPVDQRLPEVGNIRQADFDAIPKKAGSK